MLLDFFEYHNSEWSFADAQTKTTLWQCAVGGFVSGIQNFEKPTAGSGSGG